ncbi:MAG: MORN repeat-containing protein [Peptostreptococcaceae bacterium]
MNISREYVDIYNNYMKYINEVKRECRHIEHMKNRILKKNKKATENEVKVLENHIENNIDNSENKCRNKIYEFSNGDVYLGKIKDGKLDGQGVYIVSKEEQIGFEYIGEFVNDEKEGRGKCLFTNGNTYTGGFKADLMNGIGEMLYKNNDEYIGGWENGHKHGHGIYKWSDGTIYIGDFKKNKREGAGICFDKEGNIIYDGEWKNNLTHGQGTYIWNEGKKYEGQFMNGKRHGYGTFYLNNELVYQGTWKFDKPNIFNKTLDEIFSLKL